MLPRVLSFLFATVANGLLIAAAVAQDPSDAPPPPPVPQEGVDVQARGPVHEAFAEPTEVRPQPSPLVTKQPPDPISELPPDQRPEGDNVQWIPGYWAWDQDQNDFLWVSGFWRVPPPGRQWVPGNWHEVEGGWQWVPGFWASADQDQLQYLPAPPPSIDEGPSTPAPDSTSTYVPGCWVYRETRYFWRPGFWCPYQPGWLWIPAHYLWTPGGYLFVEGYWDHPLELRGLLFAPVRLARRLLAAERWYYTPQYVVQPDFLLSALFVRPVTAHYYFGDYFDPRYVRAGFVPWIDYRIGRSAFDPNFNYYRTSFAGYGRWERGLRDLYTARYRGDIPRPPRTLVQQNEVIQNITNETRNTIVNRNINITNVQNVSVLAPLTQINNTRVTSLAGLAGVRGGDAGRPAITPHVFKLQEVSRDQRVQQQRQAAQVHALAQERRTTEARLLSEGPPHRPTDRPRQVTMPTPGQRPGERSLTPRPGERPTRPVEPRPSEAPRPSEPVRPGERPIPPVSPRPGERPMPPPDRRPGERPTPPTPRPGETPRPPEQVRPGERPTPPMPPRPGDRPMPPTDRRPGERPTPPPAPRSGEAPRPPAQVRPGERPAQPAPPRTSERPTSAPVYPGNRTVPPAPTLPKHEDRPIPHHEPPRPPTPPKQPTPTPKPPDRPAK